MADNRYNFVSPGADAGAAIQQMLLQREAKQRQALLDALSQKQAEAQMANAGADNTRAAEQFAYTQKRDATEDQVRNDQARTAATERAAAAEADRTFRAGEGEKNRADKAEQAQKDREFKELIARMAQSGNMETRALANELKRMQIGALHEKQDAATTEKTEKATAAKATTQTALDGVNRLLDSKDVGGHIGAATGAYEMRGFTQGAQDFNAVRDQVVAALTQPNLGSLKGPMSDKDIVFVKQLATRLANTNMSDTETTKALQEAKLFLERKGGVGAVAALAPIRQRNTKTGAVRVSTDGGQTWSAE